MRQYVDDTDPNEAAIALIRSAVDGDARAMRQLVLDLTPSIRAGVAWALTRGHVPKRRERYQELEDVTQSVLLAVFSDRARVLLQWDPSRGLDLPSFVAMLARRKTMSVLRSPRMSPWTEDPTLHEDLDRNAMPRMGPESEAISRDMLSALSAAMRERLSPRGAAVFDLMFLEGRPAEEVCEMTGLTHDAVYAWKSRIAKQLRELFDAFARAPSTVPPPDDRLSPVPAPPIAIQKARARRAPDLKAVTMTSIPARAVAKIQRTRDDRAKVVPLAIMRARSGSSSAPPPPSERG